MSEMERLREVAEAATPGPWVARIGAYRMASITRGEDVWIGDVDHDPDATHIATFDPTMALTLLDRLAAAEATHRDLVSRLGFGNNITEPMADNDTIVAWFEEQSREAAEWREHERFRDECALAGHDPLNDCDEHGPTCCHRAHNSPEICPRCNRPRDPRTCDGSC